MFDDFTNDLATMCMGYLKGGVNTLFDKITHLSFLWVKVKNSKFVFDLYQW